MKKNNKFGFVIGMFVVITILALALIYISQGAKTRDADLLIMTSTNPVHIATLNVTKDVDGITVENLSQPTTGCLHDYTLTTEDMKKLSKADALVVSGHGMEGYLQDVIDSYPELTIIDASESAMDYALGSFADVDFDSLQAAFEENSHIWMSPALYDGQVDTIAQALAKLDGDNADKYLDNAANYIVSMQTGLDSLAAYEKLNGKNVAILHAAFEYTAIDLGANVVADMDLDEERMVSAGEVSEFIDSIQDNDVQIVLAEYDYGHDMGELIEEQTDAKVVYLETLVHGSYDMDSYVEVLNKNYSLIAQ
ncbi:MAG: metal ABC transporter substrate-binding protein [Pseudobutyrivibrio sp.]|nr:metal ABC transporter substrate-binding protein [Pseudobutyrivibrio sp.]